MFSEDIDNDVIYILEEIIEQICEDYLHICDDCQIIDSSVKHQNRFERLKKDSNSNLNLYLCDNCSLKRHEDAQNVLKDLENLAHEVEQRLEAIENTERELDQWRDQQLQKNRDFWDEYRRQVENFSGCRIRTLQYEYTIRQLKTQRIMKRLKRAKYLSENLDQYRQQLNYLIEPSCINLLSSEYLKNQFSIFLSTNQQNCSTIDEKKIFLEQIEQLASLDKIILPGDDFKFDDQIKDEIDE